MPFRGWFSTPPCLGSLDKSWIDELDIDKAGNITSALHTLSLTLTHTLSAWPIPSWLLNTGREPVNSLWGRIRLLRD
ncbi:hypothetical protein VTJ83DRAFT_6374 [Remersonia thermophila]|uniref:Uncharacterized protein n=1 Tax=Remersonia thermophila TaxID=72144 RepID=A0ABR4D6T2_9PEZI